MAVTLGAWRLPPPSPATKVVWGPTTGPQWQWEDQGSTMVRPTLDASFIATTVSSILHIGMAMMDAPTPPARNQESKSDTTINLTTTTTRKGDSEVEIGIVTIARDDGGYLGASWEVEGGIGSGFANITTNIQGLTDEQQEALAAAACNAVRDGEGSALLPAGNTERARLSWKQLVKLAMESGVSD
jgi:hypothetical protein